MRIGEVAEKAGVSVRALRYYEEQGLLQAGRSRGGQLHYPDTAVGRVRLIQQLYAAGLPSRVVREVLPCVDTGEEKADQRIIDLLAVRNQLDDVIAIARDPDSDCSHVQ
ncbi:MerR family transcriptional regulator [Streptomyces sp. RTd22]|uniref:MerR family transcriptional regulator n=1 Tax=Streptomyces sp. RTd22 TaxID=1841249 RepID=UPI0007C49CAF|nr:MerR family transcriptional regulator [Streptomyces sp. RTd22]